jgi:hypothetical protein
MIRAPVIFPSNELTMNRRLPSRKISSELPALLIKKFHFRGAGLRLARRIRPPSNSPHDFSFAE